MTLQLMKPFITTYAILKLSFHSVAISFALHDTTLWTIQGTPPKVRNAGYPDPTSQAPRLNAVRSDLGAHARTHAQIRAGKR